MLIVVYVFRSIIMLFKTLASAKHIRLFMVRRDGDSESDKTTVNSKALVAWFTIHWSKPSHKWLLDGVNESDKTTVSSKALVAWFTVHGQSFPTNDYLLTLVKKIYESKFSSSKTKLEAVIANILSPYVNTKTIWIKQKALQTVSMHLTKNIRLFQFLYSLCCQMTVFKTRKYALFHFLDEISDLQREGYKWQFCHIKQKLFFFSADNTNKRQKLQVFKTELKRQITGIICETLYTVFVISMSRFCFTFLKGIQTDLQSKRNAVFFVSLNRFHRILEITYFNISILFSICSFEKSKGISVTLRNEWSFWCHNPPSKSKIYFL